MQFAKDTLIGFFGAIATSYAGIFLVMAFVGILGPLAIALVFTGVAILFKPAPYLGLIWIVICGLRKNRLGLVFGSILAPIFIFTLFNVFIFLVEEEISEVYIPNPKSKYDGRTIFVEGEDECNSLCEKMVIQFALKFAFESKGNSKKYIKVERAVGEKCLEEGRISNTIELAMKNIKYTGYCAAEEKLDSFSENILIINKSVTNNNYIVLDAAKSDISLYDNVIEESNIKYREYGIIYKRNEFYVPFPHLFDPKGHSKRFPVFDQFVINAFNLSTTTEKTYFKELEYLEKLQYAANLVQISHGDTQGKALELFSSVAADRSQFRKDEKQKNAGLQYLEEKLLEFVKGGEEKFVLAACRSIYPLTGDRLSRVLEALVEHFVAKKFELPHPCLRMFDRRAQDGNSIIISAAMKIAKKPLDYSPSGFASAFLLLAEAGVDLDEAIEGMLALPAPKFEQYLLATSPYNNSGLHWRHGLKPLHWHSRFASQLVKNTENISEQAIGHYVYLLQRSNLNEQQKARVQEILQQKISADRSNERMLKALMERLTTPTH